MDDWNVAGWNSPPLRLIPQIVTTNMHWIARWRKLGNHLQYERASANEAEMLTRRYVAAMGRKP